jgi:hypothetical protein
MKQTKQLDWPSLLFLIAVLFGGLIRFMPALSTGFPINDGGMFYDMTRDLQANHYLLPATTVYNGLDLPYAYPPFGFYFAALLADLGRIPLLGIFLWLPPFLATLTIPAFYLLARTLLKGDLRAALAAVFFALTPGEYGWQIMGGGVTRAFGMLFLLLGVRYVYNLFQDAKIKTGVLATIFCALAVLSHPEVAIQTAGLCAVIWLFFGRTWRGTLHAALVAIGVLMLTAPWWGTILAQHGLAPFLSAGQTGLHTSASWLKFFSENFILSGLFPFIALLRVIGFIYALVKRNWLLLALLVVPYIVDPRSAESISYFGFCMIAALALLDAIPALAAKLRKSKEPVKPFLESRTGVIVLFALIFLQFIDCGLYNYRLINTTLTPADRAAMTWVQANLPSGKDFLIITTKPYSMSDPVQEWFPTLTGQHSQTTLQGLEWSLGGQFMGRLDDLALLQPCTDLACVESWSMRTGLTYDYLWLSIFPGEDTSKLSISARSLLVSVKASEDYRLVYQSVSAAIFLKVEK